MDKRKSNTQSIREILSEVMKEEKLNKGLLEHRAIALWAEVLGPTVAKVTRQIYFQHGILYVHLQSSIIRNELQMLKGKIIARLNEAVGDVAVTDIVFR